MRIVPGRQRARQPFASRFQDRHLHVQILPPDWDCVHQVETAGAQDFLQADGASRRAASSAAGNADANGRFAFDSALASLVHASPSQAVEEGAHALAQIAKIYRRRKDHRVGLSDSVNQRCEIILDHAPALCPADAPPVIFALTASFDFQLRQE
jgi:hypothetical protein